MIRIMSLLSYIYLIYVQESKKERERKAEKEKKISRSVELSFVLFMFSAQQAGLMGIAVTDGGTVFLSSSKEHALFSIKQEEMLGGTETLTKVGG